MKSTSHVSHEAISQRAHQIWEAAQQPSGCETEHWLQAERELHAENAQKPELGHAGGSVAPQTSKKHAAQKAPHSADYAPQKVTSDALHHFRSK